MIRDAKCAMNAQTSKAAGRNFLFGKFGKYGSYFGRAIGCAIVGSVLVYFGVGRDLVDTINWSHSRPKTQESCLALVVREKTGATKLVWSCFGQTKKFGKKIINIHPSLLPKYKGLNTHIKAIENKDKFAGCTVHYVTSKLDSGPIILKKKS